MYCPKCKREYDSGSKYCSFCEDSSGQPIHLVEDLQQASGLSLNLGDNNAIMGGLHMTDSHNVHNEDKSVHNISNVTNVTQVAAQKTELEMLDEKKAIYLKACKRAYEDNLLDPAEEVALEECRIKLGLDKSTANTILKSVRVMSERNASKTELNRIASTKLKRLTDNLQKNEVKALMQQIDTLEPLVNKYEHDELTRKYYLVLAALKSEKCIDLYVNTKTDNYWNTFWSYLAYIKSGRISEAEYTLASLDRFTSYPEDNMTVLATAGAIMMGDDVTAKELLNAVIGEYTPALQRFVDSIYLLLEPETAKEMGADENTCAFYLVNFFGQKDAKTKAEEERLRKEAEEAERKRKLEEKKRKAEEEAKRKAEEEARREAEEKAKCEAEAKKTAAEEVRIQVKQKRKIEEVVKSTCEKYTVQPQTNKELRAIIKERLRKNRENANLNDIDISKIKNMCAVFSGLSMGNIDISQWDVSHVTNMSFMFNNCERFNCDLSKWDVSNVKSMKQMFGDCFKFTGQGLNNWDVSKVHNMSCMFNGCYNFNCDLSKWDVSHVENMSSMFAYCEKFNSDLFNWDVSNVKDMYAMFRYCSTFDYDLSNWDVSNVEDMGGMFDECKSLKKIPAWYKNK